MATIEEYRARNAERDARRAEKQKSRRWWFTQPLPIDRFTGWLVAWTALLFVATVGNVIVLNWSDEKIGKQAEISRRQLDVMEAQQRPWIKIEKVEPLVTPLIGPKLMGLIFAKRDFVGFLPLHFDLKNVGHSPAFNVQVGVWAFYGYGQKDLNLSEDERKNCERMAKNVMQMPMATDGSNYIRVLFPDASSPYDSAGLALQPADINKFSYGDQPDKKVFQLWFYGCVAYTFSGSKEPHYTGFAYRVGHKIQVGPQGEIAQDVTFKPWESIPADLLIFESRPTAAADTN